MFIPLLKNKRWWVDCVVFVLAFIAPWWLPCIVALGAAFFFRRYIELVILGIIIDSLYNGPAIWFMQFPYAVTLCTFVAFLVIHYLKPFLRSTL